MDLKLLLQNLKHHGIPFGKAVLFVADLSEGSLGDVARELGYNRSTIYRALESGSPKADLRLAVTDLLGFDPWQYRDVCPVRIMDALRGAGVPLYRAAIMLAADRGVTLDADQIRMLQDESDAGDADARQALSLLLGVDPWGVQAESPDRRALLELLRDAGVPMHKAVALLCELAETSLAAVTRAAGCRRNTAYAAMRGEFAPAPALRSAMREGMGIDPWDVYQARRPRVGRIPVAQ